MRGGEIRGKARKARGITGMINAEVQMRRYREREMRREGGDDISRQLLEL